MPFQHKLLAKNPVPIQIGAAIELREGFKMTFVQPDWPA